MESQGQKPRAVLETSFWITAFEVQLIGYLLQVYDLVVPPAVEREIMAPNAQQPRLVYPEQALYYEVRGLMSRAPEDMPRAVRSFGAGERAAISTAVHMGIRPLLINDHKPAVYARNLRLEVMYVPTFVVQLRSCELLTDAHARSMIELCRRTTNDAIVATAHELLDELPDA